MIDERLLTDASRCPSCGAPLLGSTACRTCGVDLGGPTARAVWQVSVQVSGLLAERTRLIAALRVESSPAQPVGVPVGVPGSTTPSPVPALTASTPVAPLVARPAPEWTRRKVQNLLLSLGVGLLAVAAVIFLVVSWSLLGIGARAAVMAGCTVLAGGGAALAHRRGLGSTAEAVSLLTVGLALLDALGARSAGLAGLDAVDGLAYWAAAIAVVTALTAATAVVVPTRSLRVAAALLGQLPIPLLTAYVVKGSDHRVAVTAGGFTLATVAAAGLAAGWWGGTRTRDARLVVTVGAGLAWLVACATALGAAYDEVGSLVAGTALLLVLAAIALAVPLVGHRLPALVTAGLTASAALLVAAVWAVPTVEMGGISDPSDATWLPVVLSLIALGLLIAAVLIPRGHRAAPSLVALVAAVAPGLAALIAALATVLGQFSWLDNPWQGPAAGSARDLLAGVLEMGEGLEFTWGLEMPALLACVAAALVVASRVHGRGPLELIGVPLLALAVITLPIAQDWTFVVALGTELALAVLLMPAGGLLLRSARVGWGSSCLATGVVALGLGVVWSLARQDSTLVALPVAAGVLAVAALLLGGRAQFAAVRLSLGVASAAAGIAEAAALARAGGAGWPAVWSLALSLCAAGAVAAAVLLSGQLRRGFLVVATVSVLAESWALTIWGDGSLASAGLAMTVTAGVLAATAMWLDTVLDLLGRTSSPVPAALREDVATTAVLGGVVGVAFSALDADRLWLALLASGVAAAVVSLRSEMHRVGWAAGALLALSSWVRLVLSDVDAPEPYTVPAGVALVALGMWRRRVDRAYPSWRAYGAGLGLAMGPSLLRAVTDAGNVRPMLLGLAALVVLCSGVARRLKAPLLIGATVLAVDGIVQLSPYLAAFYDAVPRWSVIAVAGLLLVTLGVTYESRARDLRAVQERIAQYG